MKSILLMLMSIAAATLSLGSMAHALENCFTSDPKSPEFVKEVFERVDFSSCFGIELMDAEDMLVARTEWSKKRMDELSYGGHYRDSIMLLDIHLGEIRRTQQLIQNELRNRGIKN